MSLKSFGPYILLLFLLGVMSAVPPGWCHGTVPLSISVDELKEIRTVPADLFGFNHNWIFSERRIWDMERNEVASGFIERLAGLRLPLNRMAGAESQFFHWKYAVGLMRDRVEQEMVPHGKKSKRIFGPVEWVQSTLAVDPDAKFSWVFNMEKESPADHADLVEFLVADGAFNVNGGVDWAAKRIQLGLPEPIKVSVWELGNELDFKNGVRNWTVEHYIEESKKIIAAVRSVDPDAKIAAHAASAPWVQSRYVGRDWRVWHRRVLEELGSQIDFISFHPYYLGVSTAEIDRFMDEIYRDIIRITGRNRIKVYISEHAVWPSKAIRAGGGVAGWYQTHSLAGVLATAQFLNRLMARKEVEAAAYHCFSGGPWGVIYKNQITGQLYTTGIFSLYKLFGSFAGMKMLRATVMGKDTAVYGNSLKFTVSVARKGEFMLVAGVNRDGEISRDATFTFNKKYRLVKIVNITGKSLQSYDDPDGRNINVAGRYVRSKDIFNHFTFPSKSICFLLLKLI